MNLSEKDYVVVVQCQIAKDRCSGYGCETAFTHRTGGFADYPRDKDYRTLHLTCGGCCGKRLARKLAHLARMIAKGEQVPKERIVVQLASCITTDNFHAPPCPNLAYLKELIGKVGLDYRQNTSISKTAEAKRKEGIYEDRPGGGCPDA